MCFCALLVSSDVASLECERVGEVVVAIGLGRNPGSDAGPVHDVHPSSSCIGRMPGFLHLTSLHPKSFCWWFEPFVGELGLNSFCGLAARVRHCVATQKELAGPESGGGLEALRLDVADSMKGVVGLGLLAGAPYQRTPSRQLVRGWVLILRPESAKSVSHPKGWLVFVGELGVILWLSLHVKAFSVLAGVCSELNACFEK